MVDATALNIEATRAACKAALTAIREHIATLPPPEITLDEANAAMAAMSPTAKAEMEKLNPGLLFAYWCWVGYGSAGKQNLDAYLDGLLDKYCEFLGVENTTPN